MKKFKLKFQNDIYDKIYIYCSIIILEINYIKNDFNKFLIVYDN